MTGEEEKEDKMEQSQIQSQAAAETPKPVEKEKDDATELLKAMAVAAVIALVIRSFLFEPFNIPSSSMYPNLLIGDYLFVKKWSYGYSQYSFPLGIIPMKGRIMGSAPHRGDIIVFRQPKQEGVDYIKRLIALPGDTIQMKEGRLYLNGKIVPREFKGSESQEDENGTRVFTKYLETLPSSIEGGEDIKHYIYEISDREELDDTPLYTVPAGQYFMMGDNRDRSQDSRVMEALGYVPADNLIGPASFLFFSIDTFTGDCARDGFLASVRSTGCRIAELAKNIRYKRLFRRVHSLD